MRIRRNPTVRKELEECEYFINSPQKCRNKWTSHFKNNAPLHIELGCGRGLFIATIAKANPNINYLAIDIKSEMLGNAKKNIELQYGKNNIDNVLLTAWEILIIKEILDEQDRVERIYINFCNPWNKHRHNTRRLTYVNQLQQYRTFLIRGGEIYFKTDDDQLFEATKKYLLEENIKIISETYDLHSEDIFNGNIETEHEKMFTKQGIPIKALIAKIY
jgi:tRNA (guanine-N7-)-methyltransferase